MGFKVEDWTKIGRLDVVAGNTHEKVRLVHRSILNHISDMKRADNQSGRLCSTDIRSELWVNELADSGGVRTSLGGTNPGECFALVFKLCPLRPRNCSLERGNIDSVNTRISSARLLNNEIRVAH